MFSLDGIRIASPCRSDWNQMYGDERRRFCSECKLNVYNLSGMTRDEAEQLVMNAEGRLCVRFFRRKDGKILTQDCPVGWVAVKLRVQRTLVAVTSLLVGFGAALLGMRATETSISILPLGDVPPVETQFEQVWIMGDFSEADAASTPEVGEALLPVGTYQGRIEKIQKLEDVNVEVWIK